MPIERNRYNYWILFALFFFQVFSPKVASANPRTTVESGLISKTNQFVYIPIQISSNGVVKDVLSDRDIPTGDGGFARDYTIKLMAGDRIEIDLTSEMFDTVVILLDDRGKTIGKNDDAGDGSSNSLLFVRIKTTGTYIIRVQAFGATSSGEFKLKVSKLVES